MLKRLAIVMIAGVVAATSGCGLWSAEPQDHQAQGQAMGQYYEFDDVQVPRELELVRDKSFVFQAGNFKAGVLVFKGSVEARSLGEYFMQSMAKDNWVLKGSLKYPIVVLLFAKKGKSAVIRISEGIFSTSVEIWVIPSL